MSYTEVYTQLIIVLEPTHFYLLKSLSKINNFTCMCGFIGFSFPIAAVLCSCKASLMYELMKNAYISL